MNDQSSDLLDYENRQQTEQLSQKVALLKNYAIDIENETKRHNRLLDDVDGDFESNFAFLKGARNRLSRMIKTNRSPRFTLYLSLFLFSLFFFFYFILSSKVR